MADVSWGGTSITEAEDIILLILHNTENLIPISQLADLSLKP